MTETNNTNTARRSSKRWLWYSSIMLLLGATILYVSPLDTRPTMASWHNVIAGSILKSIVSSSSSSYGNEQEIRNDEYLRASLAEGSDETGKYDGGSDATGTDAVAGTKLLRLLSMMMSSDPRRRRGLSPLRSNGALDGDNDDDDDPNATPPCDTTLLRITQEEIGADFDTIIDSLAAENNLESQAFLLKLLFSSKKNYGVEMRKVCSSCKELREGRSGMLMDDGMEESFVEKYCGTTVYGYDAIFSALVTYPLGENNAIKDGLLPTYVYSRPTTFDVTAASTGTNADFSSVENLKNIDAIFAFIATMVNGHIGLSPDFMGYGGVSKGNDGWIPRHGYVVRNSYVTSTLPVWTKAQAYLKEETDCKSDVADVAFYGGYSEGAYASIAVAEGLREAFNIQPLRVSAGGGPYRWSTEQFYRIFENGPESETEFLVTNTGREFYTLLLGGSYSSTNTGLANYNNDQGNNNNNNNQDLFTPEFRTLGLSLINDTSLTQSEVNQQLVEVLIGNGSTTKRLDGIWNANILTLFRTAAQNGVRDFCNPDYVGNIVGKTDKFCEALKENDLIETIMNVQYPIEFCHSTNDEVIFYENLPDVSLNSQYLKLLTPKDTDHLQAGVECLTDEVQAIAGGLFGSSDLDQYVPQSFLDANNEFRNNNNGGCPVPAPQTTKAPTPNPTASPTTSLLTLTGDNNDDDENDDADFLYKKTKNDNGELVLTTKKCSFLIGKSEKIQRNTCASKKYQIRYKKKKDRLPSASVACYDLICNQFCVKEFGESKFLYKSKKKKGQIEVAKDCNWLNNKNDKKRDKICSKTIKYKGTGVPIYGQASQICTKTCNSC